ncbi:MAG: single-stranded-DNA-specific exonuclease RecJ [Omnitrophica WOR_2 bacterium RIFCSPHIGHO2_01_FULL_48_9]|nr:MAG: single-stranded-DNA-specific exonuclease RecJ [Omnitrophica WOR_2 bacterium RIFCSPHIGHO2_02_FULL_48_11]OGX33606.1 MAG: single-stranded-DNA-specific exonuclease RecJ [Omnitrophica WOR_2 bacterium RIFCSPHIGHO2_01_FULL_48_9]
MSPLLTTKRWSTKPLNPHLQVKLSNALQVHPIIAQLLINREITSEAEARQFLSGDLAQLYDPFLLKDMDVAVKRIHQARDNKELVLIFGDYDVDGVTSSALLNFILKKIGVQVMHFIPHRMHDGYGLNHDIADLAKEKGASLLIAVDCGITAHSEVKNLNRLGVDVIIFDHHEPSEEGIPEAVAVVNPKRADCSYPFKNLASVGLMAKLMQALWGKIDPEYLDLVALGTIADVVPLRGENRIFVKNGLPKIAQTKNLGLSALLDIAKIKGKEMRPFYVGFILGPRINATGRMDSAQKSLELFLSEDAVEAHTLAQFLEKQNSHRQKMQRDVVQEALAIVEREVNFKDHKIIVVGKQGWHKGVLGIVASRLTETYYRPSIVISFTDGMGTASARSIDGFHLHEALAHCAEVLEGYGGHRLAAGLTIKEENIDPFRDLINEFAQGVLLEEQLIPTLKIDCEISLSDLNLKLVEIIDSLEPYGEGNPLPVFCSRNLIVKSPPSVLGKDTLKFWVSDGQAAFSAVGFGMAGYRDLIRIGQTVDLAYNLSIDDWNKEPVVQLKLKDIRATM